MGYPRSGTTLLYRVLARSAAFGTGLPRLGGEDHAFETALGFYANPAIDLEQVYAQPWPHWRVAFPDADELREPAARRRRMGAPRRWLEGALTAAIFGDRGIERSTLDVNSRHSRLALPGARFVRLRHAAVRFSERGRYLRDFLARYGARFGTHRPLEKYPFHYLVMPELAGALPAAQFVFLVRHPLDVFASLLRRVRIELQDVQPAGIAAWLLLSADAFAEDWLQSLACYRAFARAWPHRILLLTYESLTAEPAAALRALGAFLDADLGALPETGGAVRDPARRFAFDTDVPMRNDGVNRHLVHTADAELIERRCGAELRALGY